MNSGTASASATHGISIRDDMSSGTMPMPPTMQDQHPHGNLQQTRAAKTEQLAGEDLVGIRRREQHLDDLVFLLGRRALHQVAGRHQHRHQEQDDEDERHGNARRSRRPGCHQ